MKSNTKLVKAPLLNSDMDTDLESATVYIFDYDNSIKYDICTDFLDYINNLGVISDVYFNTTSEDVRFKLLNYYMTNTHFNHILSFNIAIMNCIYKLKNIKLRLKGSALTDSMESLFTQNNKELLTKWIEFFDSYLMYMIIFSTNGEKDIKNRYNKNKITLDNSLSPNIVSLFLDDFFYDYYKSGINENSIKYWKYYYENKLYDNKPFNAIMLNDANFFIKILLSSSKDNRWKNYLEKQI